MFFSKSISSKYSQPLNNTCFSSAGPLICGFLSINTYYNTTWPGLVEFQGCRTRDMESQRANYKIIRGFSYNPGGGLGPLTPYPCCSRVNYVSLFLCFSGIGLYLNHLVNLLELQTPRPHHWRYSFPSSEAGSEFWNSFLTEPLRGCYGCHWNFFFNIRKKF